MRRTSILVRVVLENIHIKYNCNCKKIYWTKFHRWIDVNKSKLKEASSLNV